MKTFEPAPQATLQPIEPALAQLIERGILSRVLREETTALAAQEFAAQVDLAVSRGAVTRGQARTLGQMLGVRAEA
jgi:hypothetical protein